jgi:hypothetical protein
MAQVLRDLKELAVLLGGEDLAPDPAGEAPDPTDELPPPDLAALLAELEAAGAELAGAARRDEETRAAALRDLAAHDALVAAQRAAEDARARAGDLRRRADTLAARAFDDAARGAADRIARQAARAEEAAGCLAEARRREAEALAAAHDLAPALAERARAQEAEKARAAAAERAGRLSGLLAAGRAALEASRLEEAGKLLGAAVNEFPGEPEVASLQQILHQREADVKTRAAEAALAFARREHRRDPQAAVERLSALDVDGLPDELGRQLLGAWLRACARLCRERGLADPLRYAPRLGRGVLLVRDGDRYVVGSALGAGAAWPAGAPVGEAVLRRARPLVQRSLPPAAVAAGPCSTSRG